MALFLWLLTMATTCPTKINIPQMMGNSIEVCVRSFDIKASNKWWGVKLTNSKNWWAPFPHQIAAAGSRGKNVPSLGVIRGLEIDLISCINILQNWVHFSNLLLDKQVLSQTTIIRFCEKNMNLGFGLLNQFRFQWSALASHKYINPR